MLFCGIPLIAQDQVPEANPPNSKAKNAIHVNLDVAYGGSLLLDYERTLVMVGPLNLRARIGAGFYVEGWGGGIIWTAAPVILLGPKRHHLEATFAMRSILQYDRFFVGEFGYRYEGNKGFLFRAYAMYNGFDEQWGLGAGIGAAF